MVKSTSLPFNKKYGFKGKRFLDWNNSLSKKLSLLVICVVIFIYLNLGRGKPDNDKTSQQAKTPNHLHTQPNLRAAHINRVSNQIQNNMATKENLKKVDDEVPEVGIEALTPEDIAVMQETGLVNRIRDRYLHRPSTRPSNLPQGLPKHTSQVGQSLYVDQQLGGRTNGLYVECGASDGVSLSNSLFFERFRNWTGLLVEADPGFYKKLLLTRRRAYTLNACLSPSPRPITANFTSAAFMSGINKHFEQVHQEHVQSNTAVKHVSVQCFPLYSVLLALGRTQVDYLSLDVEGAELGVLSSVPWRLVRVDVVSVEYAVWGSRWDVAATDRKLQRLTRLMEATGLYRPPEILANLDVVFVRKDLKVTSTTKA